jgi:hypothetical protein
MEDARSTNTSTNGDFMCEANAVSDEISWGPETRRGQVLNVKMTGPVSFQTVR